MGKLLTIVAFILLVPLSVGANGRVPLSKDPQLEAGLKIVAEAHIVRSNCNEVSVRFFRALGLMNSLKSRGRELGYSDSEMKAYFDDKTQKKRVEGMAEKELEAAGADPARPESYCEVARKAIDADRGFGHYFTIR